MDEQGQEVLETSGYWELCVGSMGAPSPVGASVEIQGSTNLVDWLDLGTTQADSKGVARYRDTNVLKTLPQRYYRSRRE